MTVWPERLTAPTTPLMLIVVAFTEVDRSASLKFIWTRLLTEIFVDPAVGETEATLGGAVSVLAGGGVDVEESSPVLQAEPASTSAMIRMRRKDFVA
jgi:hypothetical protein